MLKKMLIVASFVCGVNVFAGSMQIVDTSSEANQATRKENPSSVGSRQGSNQIFGEQEITGKSGENYYHGEDKANGPNKPTQGSPIGSNQVFGNQKFPGKPGEHYYENDINNAKRPNKPTQGSKIGSNQIFGNPASSPATSGK